MRRAETTRGLTVLLMPVDAMEKVTVILSGDGPFRVYALISSMAGKDRGAHRVRSAGIERVLAALTSISRARPAIGGMTTVARNCPLRTHSWPVFVTPSQPINGVFSHRSRAASGRLAKASLAPIAMASF